MRARHAALFALVTLIACKHGGSTKLEGRWHGLRADGVPIDAQNTANNFAMSTELVFKGDQLSMATPHDRSTSTFTVVHEDKTSVIITTERDGLAQETFTFSDEKTMQWTVGDGRTMTFAKQ